MIITLDGTPGSGKNTIGERLAKDLGYEFHSMGDLMREIARQRGMSIQELQQVRATDGGAIDREVDSQQERMGKEKDNFIVTGRPSYHFIPHATKIFLKVHYKEAAKRIWKDLQQSSQRNEGEYASVDELANTLKERNERDAEIYRKYYGINVNHVMNYDLVIDTQHLTQEEVYALVEAFVRTVKK